MKDDNKKFLLTSDFSKRVRKVMESRKISLDMLHTIITQEVNYDITKSNLNLYIERLPNVNFLIALSKALSVSADYLLGIDETQSPNSSFDYSYKSHRYKKYVGKYNFYFYPTVNNSPEKVNCASFEIKETEDYSKYYAILNITTDENDTKKYSGHFILSETYDVGYITLRSDNIGEMVYLSFCDPNVIGNKVNIKTVLGAMLSTSSGDSKRVPVMSRFLLVKENVSNINMDIIKANLLLNSKYIPISKDALLFAIDNSTISQTQKQDVIKRLLSAFQPKEVMYIEESYVLNTLGNDLDLSTSDTTDLINNIRLKSISSANSKLNKSIDARIFSSMKE